MSFKSSLHKYSQEIFLFFAALFIRFPFFFRDYIDRDESTFILMGQSIADGHLPYDHLWDLKPPLLFYFFGLIEYLFPHSFVAIRFFGVVVVFLSAVLLMKIAKRSNLKNGFWIALGYTILSSEFGSLQGVMSEHLAVLFLLLGILFFLKEKNSWSYVCAGIAFGCAVLCKLNYAYAAVAILILNFLTHKKSRFKSIVLTGIGMSVPFFLILIPFLANDKGQLFFDSVFLAPLEYGRAMHISWREKLKATWWVIAAALVLSIWAMRKLNEENRRLILICIAVLTGTTYTFYSSGIVNGHYLVQIYPFVLLLVFGLLNDYFKPKLAIVAVVVIILSMESLGEYYKILKGQMELSTVYTRPSFKAVNELKREGLYKKKIFFVDYHIGYWLLDQYPLTKSTTHPSNIARPYLFKYFGNSRHNSLEELKYILKKARPDAVVSKSENLDFFPPNSSENLYFHQSLQKDFKMIYKDTIDRIYIWKRLEN